MKQSERRDCSCGCHMPQEPLKLFQVVPHSCLWRNSGSSALLGHVPPWGVPSYTPSLTPDGSSKWRTFRGHMCTATALSTWGMPAYPLATPPSRVVRTEEADERLLDVKGAIHKLVSSSCTSGKKGTGAERGCEPCPAPRNQSSSREGSGLGTRDSRLPGQAWPSALGPVRRWRQHPRGAALPHRHPQRTWTHPPMLRSTSYLQMEHRMKCWAPRGTDQRNHPGTGRDVRCVRSKRSVGACRLRGSYSNPQISQSVSRRSSARAREISTGGGRGCQSFHKAKTRSQRNHAHMPTTDTWVIHERSFSVSAAQTLKTTIVSVIRRQETTATRRARTIASFSRCRFVQCPSGCGDLWFALLEFALSVEVPRGIADERDSAVPLISANREQNKDERLCGDQHSSHPKRLRLRSKNLMSGCTCHPFIPVCTGSSSGMQNPLANFIAVFS